MSIEEVRKAISVAVAAALRDADLAGPDGVQVVLDLDVAVKAEEYLASLRNEVHVLEAVIADLEGGES